MKIKKLLLSLILPIVLLLSSNTAYALEPIEYEMDGIVYATNDYVNITEAEANVQILALKSDYPEGMSWTNDNMYSSYNLGGGGGCHGFALMVSDAVFGHNPATRYTDYRYLRVGDVLRINNNTHTVVVLENHLDQGYIIVCEGNYNSSIHWGRKIRFSQLDSSFVYGYTRYLEASSITEISPFVYEVLSDGTIKILENNLKGAVEIPEIIDDRYVTEISAYLFNSVEGITSVKLPKTLRATEDLATAFAGCDNLKEIIVDKDNPYLYSEDGVLYTHDKKELISYPIGSDRDYFVVEEEVENICPSAFKGAINLDAVKLINPNVVWSIFSFYGIQGKIYYYEGGRAAESVSMNRENMYTNWYTDWPTFVAYDEATIPDKYKAPDREAIGNFVERMYTVALGRSSDANGKADWANKLAKKERDGAGIAQGFFMSKEFIGKNHSDNDFVDILYKTFFDRAADAGGKQYWMDKLTSGTTRQFVLAGFVNSNEFTNLCEKFGISRGTFDGGPEKGDATESFVLRLYSKVLGRNGDANGVADWVSRIKNKVQTPEEVAKGFFGSKEFISKGLSDEAYVDVLYQTFMDRAADAAGKADWVGRLKAGTDRTAVLEGFSRSKEFKKIMESFGL